MTIRTEERDFLLSEKGKEVLSYATDFALNFKGDPASVTLSLKKKAPNLELKLLRACIETAIGRVKLSKRGDWIKEGLFSSIGIAQATHPIIASHHAKRLSGFNLVAEVGCSLGFDTAALCRTNKKVIAIELDLIAASFAEYNLSLQGISNVDFIVGEGISVLQTLKFDAVWSDPARRDDKGNRLKNPEEYKPSVPKLIAAIGDKPFGIKISSVAMGVSYDKVSREWIGFDDELTEQILWKGISVSQDTVTFPEYGESWSTQNDVEGDKILDFPSAPFILIEPHAAFVGSGVWNKYLESKGLSAVEKSEAFGISKDVLEKSPFYRQFRIDSVLPLRISDIQEFVDDKQIGKSVEIKKKGISENPDEIRRKLKLTGDKDYVLILTHVGARKICLAGQRL